MIYAGYKKHPLGDEQYTPRHAVLPIIKFLPRHAVVWCPFDAENSEFVIALKEAGHEVVFSHIFMGQDFFEYEPPKWDMIVSNPPYIETEEIAQLMPEVRDHEPRLALDGMSDGLYYYRSIVSQCRDYLKEDGALLFEIGAGQGAAVSELLKEAGFVSVQVIKDLAGLDRVVAGKAGTKKGKQEKDV